MDHRSGNARGRRHVHVESLKNVAMLTLRDFLNYDLDNKGVQ